MFDDHIFGDAIEAPPRFQPIPRCYRMGAQKVFYKSGGSDGPEDTPEQRQLAAVAAEKWNFSQEKLAPLQDDYMAYVDQMDSPANKSYIRGRAMQGQNQAHSGASEQLHKGLATAGIDPSSGRHQGTMNELATDIGTSGGETLGRSLFEQDSQKVMGLQNITAMGQGQSTRAQAGMSGLAQQSVSQNISDARNAFNRRSANLQLVGTVGGAGVRYGMAGGGGVDHNALNKEFGYPEMGDPFS